MTDRKSPYVGVSGVVSPEQHRELAEGSADSLAAAGRKLLVGIKATHTVQWEDRENKYGSRWYPVGDEISDVLDETIRRKTFNVAQMYFDPFNVLVTPNYAPEFIKKVTRRTYPGLDGIQIDMLDYTQDPEYFNHVIRALGYHTSIIQCHRRAMRAGPQKAIDTLKRLTELSFPDYILFDASHGQGKEMDAASLLPFLDAGYNDSLFADYGTNFAVAGGLRADNVEPLMSPIVNEFPEVSWDAEGSLHDSIAQGGDGSLNMNRVHAYLAASARLLV